MKKTLPKLPQIIEKLMMTDLERFLGSNRDLTWLREQSRKLSRDLAKNEFSEADTANEPAYFFYNFPMNFMKANILAKALIRMHPRLFAQQPEINICDLGCGEGAGMLGIYLALSGFNALKLTGIDRDPAMIRRCRRIMKSACENYPPVNVRLTKANVVEYISKERPDQFDIIILSNSLLELFPDRVPLNFIRNLFKQVRNDGAVIFIEPALKTSFHRLAQLRATAIDKFNAHVLLPCRQPKGCPLAEIPGEWCHQSIKWQPPDYLKSLNAGLNREIDVLKFSMLVITPRPCERSDGFVVISSLLKEKGKIKCYLCSENKRIEMIRLDRDRSDANDQFNNIEKGDIIIVDSVIEQSNLLWRVARQTRIMIVDRISI